MNYFLQSIRAAVAGLLIVLVACGGGGSEDTGIPPPAGTVVGAAGGVVAGPSGVTVEVPAGALAADLTIVIEQTSAGSPALPNGLTPLGPMFALTPHGSTFAVPVTLTLPFDPASVPAGQVPVLFKTTAANTWEEVANATFGTATVTAKIGGFSWVQVGGLLRNEPLREFTFGRYGTPNMEFVELAHGSQNGGGFERLIDFGFAGGPDSLYVKLDGTLVNPDGIASGQVFGSASGITYGAFAEGGGTSLLGQSQSYIKLTEGATLEFTVSAAVIDLLDNNFVRDGERSDLPGCNLAGGPTNPLNKPSCFNLTRGQLIHAVRAYTHPSSSTPGSTFFHSEGIATVEGHAANWNIDIVHSADTTAPLWTLDNFDGVGFDVSNQALAILRAPRTMSIDLSRVKVGEEFTLASTAYAETYMRSSVWGGGELESAASAFLRDPVKVGGTAITFSGLAPTNRPVAEPAAAGGGGGILLPADCAAGADPASGTIQFSAPGYSIGEFNGATQPVRVTRIGGTKGSITAKLTTSNGSAVSGTDYKPVDTFVYFSDGDAQPRLVKVPIIGNLVEDEPDKTVNLALSQPSSCTTLGAQSSAVLTIQDDDSHVPPPPPSNFGLDTTFGTAGKADTTERGGASTAFGGDRSAMALQADGKIVMVGGSASDFLLARFNADGNLDTSFGTGGKVVTDFGSGLRQEEALAVAIQNDGKIVVAGYTAIDLAPPAKDPPPTFALARYNADGSLDASFGTGGRVSGNVNGIAYVVAIQPDGKIVVAGEFAFATANGSDFSDIVVARFNSNGSLDTSFGTSGTGQVTADIGALTNTARNLVLQPDGAIVISGKPTGSSLGFDHTDIVRYTANGALDASFGSGGKLTLAGVDVGQGLARQADGKFVLVGAATTVTVPATSRFLLKRLNADGSADAAFGNAGTVDIAFTVNAAASAVVMQADGRIVVAGTTALSANSNFLVARYRSDGTLDASFSNGTGVLAVDYFGDDDIGENVLVQPDGKIVVSGQARNNVDGYGLARINP
jgi:uncharacterized delta-60 repeat protein